MGALSPPISGLKRRSAAPGAAVPTSELVARPQGPRIGAAEAGARRDREAPINRLSGDAAFDREIAEDARARRAELQGRSLAQEPGLVDPSGSAADARGAIGAGERDAHIAFRRPEDRAQRADLDRGRPFRLAHQGVGDRERDRVHGAARRQPITLRAETPDILDRGRGPDRIDVNAAHGATSSTISATGSPASAARSSASHSLSGIGKKLT